MGTYTHGNAKERAQEKTGSKTSPPRLKTLETTLLYNEHFKCTILTLLNHLPSKIKYIKTFHWLVHLNRYTKCERHVCSVMYESVY